MEKNYLLNYRKHHLRRRGLLILPTTFSRPTFTTKTPTRTRIILHDKCRPSGWPWPQTTSQRLSALTSTSTAPTQRSLDSYSCQERAPTTSAPACKTHHSFRSLPMRASRRWLAFLSSLAPMSTDRTRRVRHP